MLKRDITYENFDGENVTETFYFNLTKTEVFELQVEYEGGLEGFLKRIINAEDQKSLFALFKKFILLSYGIKSDDGKRFIKSDQLREEFSQTAAYDTLFMELGTDDNAAATFIKGVVPKDFQREIDKIEKAQTAVVPLPPTRKE